MQAFLENVYVNPMRKLYRDGPIEVKIPGAPAGKRVFVVAVPFLLRADMVGCWDALGLLYHSCPCCLVPDSDLGSPDSLRRVYPPRTVAAVAKAESDFNNATRQKPRPRRQPRCTSFGPTSR